MNRSLRFLTAVSALALAALSARAADPGYLDPGAFKIAAGCEFVEVNLHMPMLKLAALFVGHDDPEAAALIRNLKHVRVNVIGYDESNRTETADRVQAIRAELAAQGWTQMVTVRQNCSAEDVAIYVKSRGEEAIDGIVVTVFDPAKHEAVFVNIVGNIKPEQLASLGRGLRIDHLSFGAATHKGA